MPFMEWVSSHLLTAIVFLPLAWAALGWILPLSEKATKLWCLAGALLTFLVSLPTFFQFDPTFVGFQFAEKTAWLPDLGIHYEVGLDGISLWLILLTTFLTPLVILGSFESIQEKVKPYYLLLLSLETGMLGAFVALDGFLFYMFWEAMLIPMYFLVGVWGGKERIYAAMKFFIFTLVGSLLMLVALFYLASQYQIQTGAGPSLSLLDLMKVQIPGDGYFSPQSLLFLAFAIAFAIKVPLFPLHTWLPDAHVQAPTAGSVILAGVLLKLGGYGLIRFALPLFPQAVVLYRDIFLCLGAIAIVYGALVAMVQPDMKKLVAYSSVSHMGYVILGIFSLNPIGMTGAVFQMLAHGISTSGLFVLVGVLYDRRHTREISAYGGIAAQMPLFATAFLVILLASAALPGTNGFVGEFLILLGTFQASRPIAAVAGLGVIFGAVYLLWMYQRVLLGPVTHAENSKLSDLNWRESTVLVPLIILAVVMGIAPGLWLGRMETSITQALKPYTTTMTALQGSSAVTETPARVEGN